jgi:signal transduction histidine kinase
MYQDMLTFTGHELHNQLSILNLAVAKLEQESGAQRDEQQQSTIKRIQQCAAALQRISRSYLDARHVEKLSFAPRPTLIDPVRDVIEPVLFSYANALSGSGQTCQIKSSRSDLLVWADRDLLMSVYDNLIGNAIRHGEPGDKIVLTMLERDAESELRVWNSGPGIAAENLETIFERFTSISASKESTGIGLYLARKIVEAHSGRLWADSILGVWANFTFTLPKRGTTKAVTGLLPRTMQ